MSNAYILCKFRRRSRARTRIYSIRRTCHECKVASILLKRPLVIDVNEELYEEVTNASVATGLFETFAALSHGHFLSVDDRAIADLRAVPE